MAKIINVDIKEFLYGDQVILKDILFDVEEGECIVLTGLSGCGKTTLTRLMNGLIPNVYEGEFVGNITLFGKSIKEYKSGELAKYIGNVFQNPNDQFFAKDVESEIALVGENLGLEKSVLEKRITEAMEKIKITDLRDKKVTELSGGQKQKVALASTLVFDSKLIILDEPSANLDYLSTLEVMRILEELKRNGKTIIIVEHRLSYLNELFDRMMVMKDGTIEGIYSKSEMTREIKETQFLRSLNLKELFSEADEIGEKKQIEISNISVKNKGYCLSNKVNIDLFSCECMALVGENGIGKTTVARELTGLLPIYEGTTSLGSKKKTRLESTSISLQNCSNMFFYETVEKELIPKSKKENKEYLETVKKYLIKLELWDKRYLNPHDLSGGEKQRLALIIALLKPSKLIILDEPTAGLDYKRMLAVADVIKEKCKETPIILITHDMELLFKVCNTAYLMTKKENRKVNVKSNEDYIMTFLGINA